MRFGLPEDFDGDDDAVGGETRPLVERAERKGGFNKSRIRFFSGKTTKSAAELSVLPLLAKFAKFAEEEDVSARMLREKFCGKEDEILKRMQRSMADRKGLAQEIGELICRYFDEYLTLQAKEIEHVIAAEDQRRRDEEMRRKKLEQEQREKAELERKQREHEEAEGRRKEAEEKKRQEEVRRREEEARKREQEVKELREKAKQEEQARQNRGMTDFDAVKRQFLKYKKDIQDIKEGVVEPLKGNQELKRAVGTLKRKINPKFGQLSNSHRQLGTITSEVISLITEAKNANKLAFDWILNFVAKAIVSQAETEVTVKLTAALPLARLTYTLLETFTELEYFLMARFVKKCPFVIGYTCSIDSEEGRLRMGWKRNGTKWEDDTKYDERVAGICTVWSVLTRLPQQSKKNFTIASSWAFVARILNTDLSLLTNGHFACAGNWWEACANDILSCYGKQAFKLLKAFVIDWPNLVKDKRFPAAARLSILGEEWAQEGKIASIKEMEP